MEKSGFQALRALIGVYNLTGSLDDPVANIFGFGGSLRLHYVY